MLIYVVLQLIGPFSVDVETRDLDRGYSAFWNELTDSVLQRRPTTEMP